MEKRLKCKKYDQRVINNKLPCGYVDSKRILGDRMKCLVNKIDYPPSQCSVEYPGKPMRRFIDPLFFQTTTQFYTANNNCPDEFRLSEVRLFPKAY